ncbi:DMT family transporter [Clostridium massiliodielmoense]|uniref:DMT family transporter n=1 Tax=Clostridium massiliodielmoense TaxID=1776385 RepID=UPI0004D9A961|nr:DMT family transporter [Clostridium massiliodielmoense]KEH99403.1 membrane protein [Clostridium botulinum C/D str. BKT12695]
MSNKRLGANVLLLITAAIWGLGFVAQRVGAENLGAFTFNAIRFGLGGVSLIPLILYFNGNKKKDHSDEIAIEGNFKTQILPGIMLGIALYIAATLQQIGLAYTTAAKAGFITGMYIVLVPIMGVFIGQKIEKSSCVGIMFSIIGLYLLSINSNFSISNGDLLEIIGAIFWATHILMIDYFSKKVDSLKLSCIQFITCSILSLLTALGFEVITLQAIYNAMVPLLYGGFLSVGVAYTLQVVAQKSAKPSHAVIILSMEAVFGAVGGVLLLGEEMTRRGFIGCAFILVGILASQIKFPRKKNIESSI